MRKLLIIALLSFLCFSCGGGKQNSGDSKGSSSKEDVKAKERLQGIWVDDNTDIPLFMIKGDSLYFADSQSLPLYFMIVKDSLYIYGHEKLSYRVDHLTEFRFWFHSLSDDLVKLYRSENELDSVFFTTEVIDPIPIYTSVVQKDSVVFYKDTRYRGYVYINPSNKRVTKTSYTEEGLSQELVYFDNVIHICVYEGKKELYAQDITKDLFQDLIDDEFYGQSILSDMDFLGVDSKGYHYLASICIPESVICNVIKITISFNNEVTLQAIN